MDPQRWREVERLYHLAREREAGEREKFIAEACGGDESLRREVESLMARPPEGQDFLEAPALEVAARALAKDKVSAPPIDLTGRTIAHYRVMEKIGEGGMGVVYRGHDSRLKRDVAIKVLPDVFAGDLERKARFEREARLLATLTHPNIAAIHGLEEAESKPCLIIELVEGQTLAERLKKGRIPMDETLDICRQVAEGLEAAHEKGVIHRDLKPGNVMITSDDKVKILDFGLAKALAGESRAADAAHPPTITDEMTRPGVILGTAAYMSPEQAKGKTVDKRADIWAFGCVLYECLTGKRAFERDTITETMAAILKSEPDWALLPIDTPPVVRAVLRQCLQKEPARRLHDIADARVEMGDELGEPSAVVSAAPRFPPVWVLSIGVAMLAVGFLTGWVVMKYIRPAASPMSQSVVRSSVRIEPGHWLDGWRFTYLHEFDRPSRTAMAVSNHGRFIVYSAVKENSWVREQSCLYLRRTDQSEAKPIVGTDWGMNPFLSPDDRWVGFFTSTPYDPGELMKVSVEGGVPTPLCDVAVPFGFSWGSDNQIVFAGDKGSGLSRISADGGKPEALTIPDKSNGEYSHRLPHCLPAGKGILFTIKRNAWDHQPRVAVLEPGTRKWRVLLEDAADARYVAGGYLAFLRRGTLMVVPFDPDKLQVTGQPVPALANVVQSLNTGASTFDTAAGQFCISSSGSLVYASGGILPDPANTLVWVDHKGNAEPITSVTTGPYESARLSPDGQRIAYSSMGMEGHIRIHDLNRATTTQLTSEGRSCYAVWTPNGRRVAFDSVNTGVPNIFWQAVDGSSSMERLTLGEYFHWPGSWSPDGETLAFVQDHPNSGYDILLLRMRDRRVTPFLNSRFNEMFPEFSPDGRWMAYVSDESGRDEVYVQPFPGPGGKWQISNEGGWEPLWARNGKKLFYRQLWSPPECKFFVVDVQTGSDFSPSKPGLLFQLSGYLGSTPIRTWDISPDGQRFLMAKHEERKPQPVTELILVQNWFEELKRLSPAK